MCVALLHAGSPLATADTATMGRRACTGPEVLLVHDLAGTAGDWDLLADDLRSAGWCPVAVDWGRPRPGDVPLPVGGLTGVDAAAVDLARDRGWISASADADAGAAVPVPGIATAPSQEPVAVVAKGVGGLVAQRAVQLAVGRTGRAEPPISALVTVGPVWNGTNVLGIADVENLSRALGTYDAVLAWERTWMDPICEGCREAVRGSDLLVRLHADGLRTRGVVYTDIVSTVDLLVHPPLEQSPPGWEVRVARPFAGGRPVWHGELGRDPDSRGLVVEALGPT